MYPTVRERRSFYPPSPDDSGYFSPSETQWRARRWKLRVVNTTPPPASPSPLSPPSPPPATTTSLLFAEQEEDEDDESQNFLSRDLSSGWSASSSADSTSTIVRFKTEEKKKKKDKEKEKRYREYLSAQGRANNICTRALRRAARKCIGKKVLAAKRKMMKKLSPGSTGSVGAGFAFETRFGETDGAKEEKNDPSAGTKKRVSERWVRVGVLERIKRTLLRKKGPLELKRAQVRFPLD